MIEFHLNGERMRINTDASVEEFLRAQGFELKFIAIERDREILPRALWTQAKMSEGKSYEVVRFVFIKRGAMPDREILRSMIASRNSPELNAALQKACVGVAGLGGLGSNIALSLARAGVAKLVLADFDVVEPSNLNRQQYYVRHIGMKKTDAMKELIADVNPFVEVVTRDVFLDAANVAEIFAPCSIVCEAFDNAVGKAMMVNEAGASLADKQIIGASGMAGYYDSNLIRTIKFAKNVHLCGDLVNAAKIGQGLMAPRVAICANHQANLVIRLLLGLESR